MLKDVGADVWALQFSDRRAHRPSFGPLLHGGHVSDVRWRLAGSAAG
jgi:hypothetical protein